MNGQATGATEARSPHSIPITVTKPEIDTAIVIRPPHPNPFIRAPRWPVDHD